jgi:hypothetical protein
VLSLIQSFFNLARPWIVSHAENNLEIIAIVAFRHSIFTVVSGAAAENLDPPEGGDLDSSSRNGSTLIRGLAG